MLAVSATGPFFGQLDHDVGKPRHGRFDDEKASVVPGLVIRQGEGIVECNVESGPRGRR